MDHLDIDLNGSAIADIALTDGCLRIRFARAILIRTLTGAVERTRWWQAGTLIIEDATLETPIPAGPLVCQGGDIDDNIYTYRDMIPIPLASRGRVGCALRFAGQPAPFVATGTALRLEMADVPKYIEHIRPAG